MCGREKEKGVTLSRIGRAVQRGLWAVCSVEESVEGGWRNSSKNQKSRGETVILYK